MLLWRQVPSVWELSRVLAREDGLWAPRLKVSQQALSQRFMRYRSALISEGDSELRVIEKCGDSTYKNTISGGADIGERIEQGYYRGEGGRGKLHIITLQGGRVSKTELEFFR